VELKKQMVQTVLLLLSASVLMTVGLQTASISTSEKMFRALTFYSKIIPIFSSYTLLKENLKIQRDVFNNNISKEEEEKLWDEIHEWGSDSISNIIQELKGFYVKTGQVISTRVDIFPVQYTSKLATLQDNLDPIPASVVREVISRDLLNGGDISELFAEFDDEPLGSASIAQVHKAKLLDGRTVAVKVQRPGVEAKLLGDISNIKAFTKAIAKALPIDYYMVCCELERTLVDELDFFHEAVNTQKVAAAVAHSPSNARQTPAVIVPQPLPGLVCKTVMVLEFIDGVALSKLASEMSKRGVKAGSPESVLLGTKLLTALTDAYSSMIFGSGMIHVCNSSPFQASPLIVFLTG
jgi:aarF domain-containing kinase